MELTVTVPTTGKYEDEAAQAHKDAAPIFGHDRFYTVSDQHDPLGYWVSFTFKSL